MLIIYRSSTEAELASQLPHESEISDIDGLYTSDLRTCCNRAFDVFSMSCHVLTDLNRGIS